MRNIDDKFSNKAQIMSEADTLNIRKLVPSDPIILKNSFFRHLNYGIGHKKIRGVQL